MNKITNGFSLTRIADWNKERQIFEHNIDFEDEVAILYEEFLELLGYDVDKDEVKLLLAPLLHNDRVNLDNGTASKIDALADIIVVATGMIERRGYNSNIVMDEVLKHIESRTGEFDDETGKWQKHKVQKNEYRPDFTLALRK